MSGVQFKKKKEEVQAKQNLGQQLAYVNVKVMYDWDAAASNRVHRSGHLEPFSPSKQSL